MPLCKAVLRHFHSSTYPESMADAYRNTGRSEPLKPTKNISKERYERLTIYINKISVYNFLKTIHCLELSLGFPGAEIIRNVLLIGMRI